MNSEEINFAIILVILIALCIEYIIINIIQ